MIAYFPTPYPDEIFYSLIARFCKHSSAKGPKELLVELFGTSNASATIDLPSHLAYFQKQTSCIFNKDLGTIITDYTLLPFYAPFISGHNLEKILFSMAGQSGDIHTRIGINAGVHPALSRPKYCPICFKQDKALYGEAYWHRSHQIPSIKHCHLHNCLLHSAGESFLTLNKHYFIPADAMYCTNENVYLNLNPQIPVLISKALTLLCRNSGQQAFPYHYRDAFIKSGLAKGKKTIDQHQLFEAFSSFYSKETLTYFNSNVQYDNPGCWLKVISRKLRKSIDPLRHILIGYFLEHLHSNENCSAFTSGPWLCLNPVCIHYKTAVIKQMLVRYIVLPIFRTSNG